MKIVLLLFLDCAVGEIQFSPEDCQKYRLCETSNFGSLFGVWKEYSCPAGFYFDFDSNACQQAKDTDCPSKFRLIREQQCLIIILNFVYFSNKLSEKCVNKERLPYNENCVFFKECINGTYNLLKCPRIDNNDGTWMNQMFDERTKKCINKQKLAIPGDCKTYKECISIGPAFNIENWRESICPISMNFDPVTEACVAKNKYECCKYFLNI